ncbi:uncharacterized protein LOC111892033 [Lactuca sativa]|uniref:uncharacterized protein LOC111892033 n=1 Tax=Lactuca sativa TaxID=4236 RepID=UPI000CD97CE0|nr:uncharacterized protein LOC111892033 [Lactuca sativa]
MEFFNDQYVALSKAAATAATAAVGATWIGVGRAFQYRDFDNMNSLVFEGVQDPIIGMRWLSDVEGCFFMCSCPADQKVKCALNVLQSGAKDWWMLVTSSYTPEQRASVSWEQFSDMFRSRYVPLVEWERVAQEYLDLRQGTELVMEITKMFTKRAMFFHKFVASEKAQMTRYLSILKTDIR